ncbi:MAG: HAD-IB family hydrolase, partial [Acidimicrobiia bacterium]|nr:HAD-IB family hydrolase [Acidimicrobiia bacterium]
MEAVGTGAAFFDLDKTVIAKSATLAFARPLHRAGLLRRRTLLRAAMSQAVYRMTGADQDKLDRLRDH